MEQQTERLFCAIKLVFKSVALSAHWIAVLRRVALAKLNESNVDEVLNENIFLRHELAKSRELVAILRGQLEARRQRRRLTIKERLAVLWHMECKWVPPDIERTRFAEPRTTAWRLKRCA